MTILVCAAACGLLALGGCVGRWTPNGDIHVVPLVHADRPTGDPETGEEILPKSQDPKLQDPKSTSPALDAALASVMQEYRDDVRNLPPADRARVLAALTAISRGSQPAPSVPSVDTQRDKTQTGGTPPATQPTTRTQDTAASARASTQPVRGSIGDSSTEQELPRDTRPPQPAGDSAASPSRSVPSSNADRPATLVNATARSSPERNVDDRANATAATQSARDAQRNESLTSDWKTDLQRAVAALRRELAQPGEQRTLSDSELARRELVLKMMQVASGDTDKALTEFQYVDREEAEFWRNELFGLHLGLRENRTPIASQRAARMLEHLRKAAWEMSAISTLDLRNAAFCKNVFGYADVEPFRPYRFKPDQEVLLYVEIENFAAERIAGVESGRSASNDSVRYETEFHGTYQILDRERRRVANQQLPQDKQSCRNHRRDYYIAYRIYLPRNIAPGDYTLELTLEDVKGRKFGQAFLDFEISQ